MPVRQDRASRDQPAFHQHAEGDARLFPLRRQGQRRAFRQRFHRRQPRPRARGIGFVALDADEAAAQPLGDRRRGAGAEEGIQHHLSRLGAGQDHAVQQRLGLLGRVQLVAVRVAQTLMPGAERDEPVAPHLKIVVQRLHRLVVEAIARFRPARGPDQRLMRVGEATPPEIRHRVGLAPDDVVQDPEPEVLQRGAEPEDVVVAADHPHRAVLAQDAAAFRQPFAREGVIGGEIVEAVPGIIHRIDHGGVGPAQLALQLKVVGRIGEDGVDRGGRQGPQRLDAVADQDLVQRQVETRSHDGANCSPRLGDPPCVAASRGVNVQRFDSRPRCDAAESIQRRMRCSTWVWVAPEGDAPLPLPRLWGRGAG